MKNWFYSTEESAYEYDNEDDAPYIDNIIYVSCAEYDWCTWPGMYYFSMRKPLESEAGNLLYLVRTRSENNNTERVKSGAAG